MATEPLTRPVGYPDDWEPPRRASVEEFRRISEASDRRYDYRDGWIGSDHE